MDKKVKVLTGLLVLAVIVAVIFGIQFAKLSSKLDTLAVEQNEPEEVETTTGEKVEVTAETIELEEPEYMVQTDTYINDVEVGFYWDIGDLDPTAIDYLNMTPNELLELGGFTYDDLKQGTQRYVGSIGGSTYVTLFERFTVYNDYQKSLANPDEVSTIKVEISGDDILPAFTNQKEPGKVDMAFGTMEETLLLLGEPVEIYENYNLHTERNEPTMKYEVEIRDEDLSDLEGTVYYHIMFSPDKERTTNNFLTREN